MNDRALLEHAAAVAEHELRRASGRLRCADPAVARAVERAAHAVAAGVARCLAETAVAEPALAAALVSGTDRFPSWQSRPGASSSSSSTASPSSRRPASSAS